MNVRLFILPLFFLCTGSYAQDVAFENRYSDSILQCANSYAKSFLNKDYTTLINYIHPLEIEKNGGRTKMIETFFKIDEEMKNTGEKFTDVTFHGLTEIKVLDAEYQCVLIKRITTAKLAKFSSVRIPMVCISNDKGKTWRFIDSRNKNIETMKKMYPNLSSELIIPNTIGVIANGYL